MRRFALPVLCAALLAPAAPAQSSDDAALREYYSGNGLLNRGLYDRAAAEYRVFLDKHPEHEKVPLARYGLGVCLFRRGDYVGTIETLGPLEPDEDFPYAAEVLMMRGQSRLALEDPQRAAAVFGEVLRDHADHDLADEAAALQAEAFYNAGMYDQVEEPCLLLEARWPQSPPRERAELFRGLADIALNRYPQAARRFDSMLRQYPDGEHADRARLLLAQSQHYSGDANAAIRTYRAVIRDGGPAFIPDAMYGLAILLHRGGRLDEAGALLDQLIEQHADRDTIVAAARLLRGRVWFDLEQYDRALEQFERLADTGGAAYQDDAAYWSAKCALRRGDHRVAARELAQSLERYPGSDLVPQMTYDRAIALLRSGEPESAIEVLGEFRARYKDHELSADALELLAAAHHQQGRYGQSLALCEEFQQQYPDHQLTAAVVFLTAENTFLLEDYDSAAERYQALLDTWPDHEQADQARFRLGMALHQKQRYDEARPWLEQVASGRSTQPEFRSALLALGDGHFQQERWQAAEEALHDYLSFGVNQPSADDALLKLGLARQRQEEYLSALTAFQQLEEQFSESPHRVHALFESGQVLVELDRPDEAVVAFHQVLAEGGESPFAPHAMNHLGALALAQGNDGEAAGWFGRAAHRAADPQLASDALFQQGQALMAARSFEAAAPVLERFAAEYPDHERRPEAAALHAIALARRDGMGRAEALTAIESVETEYLVELDPSLRSSLWYEKAWCLRELKRADEAADAYRQVINQDAEPGLVNHALLELAAIEYEAERYQESADLLRTISRRASADPSVPAGLRRQCTYRLGLCEFYLDNHHEAADLLGAWLEDEPDPDIVPSARLLCAEALMQTGRHLQAAEQLRRVIDEHPDDEAAGPSMLRLGEAYASLQYWPQSEQTFRSFLERWPDSELWFQARFGTGWAAENQGRYDDAMKSYREVVDRHQGPTAARAQFQIGECLFAQKDYDQAVSELLKVDILYAYPEWSAAALYEAGRCFQEAGNPIDARKQYEQLQRGHPQTKWAELADDRLGELAARSLPGH